MSERIDVSGLSCPQPVFETRKKMKEMGKGVFEVRVDSGTSRDNITRMAVNEGWKVEVKEKKDEYILILSKLHDV